MFLFYFVILLFSPFFGYAQPTVQKQGDRLVSPFVHVYDKVALSVVRIDVSTTARRDQQTVQNPWEYFFGKPQQQQQQKQIEGMGSGVIIDREGHILTNNHVISGAEKISVKVNEDETYDAVVVGTDPDTDLAVIQLQLDGKQLPPEYVAELGDSDTLKPGDYAIAIGNPIGLERTINVGVISALGRHDFTVYGSQSPQFQNFIQTDAQINPGNSGGALADISGKVIGINDMYTAQFAGIGFAIPINLARNVMTQLIASGVVKRGFVGIRAEEEGITPEIKDAMELSSRDGVLIKEVVQGSPAEKAGLKHGDVIVSLDGDKVKNFNEFLFKIGDHAPGDTVQLQIIREKEQKALTLTLASRNDFLEAGAISNDSWLGIQVVELSSPAAQQFKLEKITSGVVVVKIDSDSPASKVNLRAGDVIVEIENKEIKDIQDFLDIRNDPDIKEKKYILIFRQRVYPNGHIEKGFVAVKSK
ncbi:PDZ domain-containing protein [bacterium]|nr:PDZ domain-containing protein [bacterium]